MKRTQSALALLLAIGISFAVLVLVSSPINQRIITNPSLAEWISTATFAMIILLFFTVFGLLQKQLSKNQEQEETALLVFPTVEFKTIDALGGIAVIALVLILPALQLRNLSLARMVVTSLCLLIYWILLKISEKSLRILCTRHRMMIVGFDARLMIPDPNGRLTYANPTGFLAYDRIAGYQLSKTTATLFLQDENAAPILIPVQGEKSKQLQGIMAMHRIQRWYPQTP